MNILNSKNNLGNEQDSKPRISGFFNQDFWRSHLVQWVLIMTIFMDLGCWGILLFYIRPIDLPIVLHYNVYLGVDLIGEWWQAYFLPIISNIFLVINTILAYIFYQKKERIAGYIFLLLSFFVQAGGLVAVLALLFINY